MFYSESVDLIRYVFFGGTIPIINDWDVTIRDLKQHALIHILYLVSDSVNCPQKYISEIKNEYYRQIFLYTKVIEEQTIISNSLIPKGITPIILKGASSAQYYKNPLIRTVGDIDVLVTGECCFNIAAKHLIELGYKEKNENSPQIGSINDSTFRRHIEFVKSGIEVELHTRYSSQNNKFNKNLEQFIINAIPEIIEIDKCKFYSLPALENGLVLLHHLSYHLVKGVGFRQVIDWACYAETILTDEFWNDSFSNAADRIGLKRFAIYVTRMCELYFGIQVHEFCKDADINVCYAMIKLISEYGNFGINADPVSLKVNEALNSGNALNLLQRSGEVRAKNNSIFSFRPFSWIYGLFHAIKNVLTSKISMQILINSIITQRNNRKLFKKLHIGRYRKIDSNIH